MDIVLINLDKDTERLERSKKELSKFNLTFKRIPGIVDDNPQRGFSLAMVNALNAIPNGGVIFEDDVMLLDFNIPDLPDGWDMLYLGANLRKHTTRVNDQLVRVFGAWTTHAVLYSMQGVEKVLSQYCYESHGIYDEWLRTEFNAANNCYMVTPMQAYQYPGQSNIFGIYGDYREGMDNNFKKYTNANQ